MSVLLEVEDLRVQAVGPLSYSVDAGDSLAIVGEPGSGKTIAALALTGLTRPVSGRILFEGRDLLALPDDELRRVRGNEIGMTFQDPPSSLHPFYRLGWQVAEVILEHRRVSKAAARDRAIDLLELVGLPEPHRCVDFYPHEVTEVMIERAVVAIAIANEPKLLIADGPTRAQLELLAELRERSEMAIIVTSRDQSAIAGLADEIYELSSSST